MDNRSLTYLTAIVLAGTGILLVMNILPIFWSPVNEKYLSYNGVKGIAVVHDGKYYTLNFNQQNETIDMLNMSLKVGKQSVQSSEGKPSFDKIVIYLFNAPDMELTPVAMQSGSIIFQAPSWNPDGYMKEVSKGEFKKLIENAYDK